MEHGGRDQPGFPWGRRYGHLLDLPPWRREAGIVASAAYPMNAYFVDTFRQLSGGCIKRIRGIDLCVGLAVVPSCRSLERERLRLGMPTTRTARRSRYIATSTFVFGGSTPSSLTLLTSNPRESSDTVGTCTLVPCSSPAVLMPDACNALPVALRRHAEIGSAAKARFNLFMFFDARQQLLGAVRRSGRILLPEEMLD